MRSVATPGDGSGPGSTRRGAAQAPWPVDVSSILAQHPPCSSPSLTTRTMHTFRFIEVFPVRFVSLLLLAWRHEALTYVRTSRGPGKARSKLGTSRHDSAVLTFDELEYRPFLLKTAGDPADSRKLRTVAHHLQRPCKAADPYFSGVLLSFGIGGRACFFLKF